MSEGLQRVALVMPVFLISLSFHEFAHGWMALKRGDSTAKDLGRLSLNPLAHADLVGTLLLPFIGLFYGIPIFGWAKPVPVDFRNLKRPLLDTALVAIAGPLSNICLAIILAILMIPLFAFPSGMEHVIRFGILGIQFNLMLCLFNLLPLPPLDGFRIVQGFLFRKHSKLLESMERFGVLVVILLFVSGALEFLVVPITDLTVLFLETSQRLSFSLLGPGKL